MATKIVVSNRNKRMQPALGGDPLPLPPVVMPDAMRHTKAKEYVQVLDKELNETGEHEGRLKWSGNQRQYIRELRAKWFQRGEGQDPHYERFGTFPRPWGAQPPGVADYVAALWKRRAIEEGVYVPLGEMSSQRKRPTVHDIVKALKKLHRTKDIEPKDD